MPRRASSGRSVGLEAQMDLGTSRLLDRRRRVHLGLRRKSQLSILCVGW